MIRFIKMTDLLYFKGKINNKHIMLNELKNKETDDNVSIIK